MFSLIDYARPVSEIAINGFENQMYQDWIKTNLLNIEKNQTSFIKIYFGLHFLIMRLGFELLKLKHRYKTAEAEKYTIHAFKI